MTLENIINKAIPMPSNACRIIRAKIEWQRQQMIDRLEQGKDLHMVPEWAVKQFEVLKSKQDADSSTKAY